MSQESHWVIMREWNQCQIQIPYLSLINNLKWFFVNFVGKKLDPLTWSEQMHVDHKQATQVKYMLCQANNRLLRYDHCHQPFFLVIVVYSINYVLLTILHNFPHGSTNHMTSCIRRYGQTMAFTCKIFQKIIELKKNDWLEFQLSQIHVCLHKIWNSSRENWNPLISPQG